MMKRKDEKFSAMVAFTTLAYKKNRDISLRKMQAMQRKYYGARLHHTTIMRIRKQVALTAAAHRAPATVTADAKPPAITLADALADVRRQRLSVAASRLSDAAAAQDKRDRRMMTAAAIFAIAIFLGTLIGLIAFCGTT